MIGGQPTLYPTMPPDVIYPGMMPYPFGGVINTQPGSMEMGDNCQGNVQQKTDVNVIVNNDDGANPGTAMERRWYTSMFGCTQNIPGCLCSAFCPYIYLCCVYRTYDEALCAPLCLNPFDALFVLRLYVRGLEHISGGVCSDCGLSYFCCWCVMCQLQNEFDFIVKYRHRCIIGTLVPNSKWHSFCLSSAINIGPTIGNIMAYGFFPWTCRQLQCNNKIPPSPEVDHKWCDLLSFPPPWMKLEAVCPSLPYLVDPGHPTLWCTLKPSYAIIMFWLLASFFEVTAFICLDTFVIINWAIVTTVNLLSFCFHLDVQCLRFNW